jgi:hypothetical protein
MLSGGKPAPPRRASPLMSKSASQALDRDLTAQAAAAAAAQEADLEERAAAQAAFMKRQQAAEKKGEAAPQDPWDNLLMLREMTMDGAARPIRPPRRCPHAGPAPA